MSSKSNILPFLRRFPLVALLGCCVPSLRADEPAILNRDPALHHGPVEAAGPHMPRADTGSVVELPNGDLFIAYQKFDGDGTAHDHALSRVWSRVSHDEGRTWVEPRMLVDSLPGDVNVGIPALLLLPSGELLMICTRTHTASSSTMCVYRSKDYGKTFAEEPPVWSHSEGIRIQGGANSLVLLKSGRILLPFAYGPPGGDTRKLNSKFYVSDDSGHSWRLTPGVIELPRRGADEPSVAELEDGQLVAALRTSLGGPYLSYSSDQGETWSAAEPAGCPPEGGFALWSGESCTCLRRIPGTNALLLIWNNTPYVPNPTPTVRHLPGGSGHFGKRTPLTAAVSCDAGKTWVIVGDLASGPDDQYSNPNCTFTRKRQAVITYLSGHLTKPWPTPAPHRISLWSSVADFKWLEASLAEAAKLAAAPVVYHVPGSDDPRDKPKP